MSISAAHSAAFFKEAIKSQSVWTIRDAGGIPTSTNQDGETAMPFWSSRKRALKITNTVPAYKGFGPEEISLEAFVTRWLPGLKGDGLRAGINWAGKFATGYDMDPDHVISRLKQS